MADKLSIFSKDITGDVTLSSSETVETLLSRLHDIEREQILLRKGMEAETWGQAVEDMEEVDMSEVPDKEIANGS